MTVTIAVESPLQDEVRTLIAELNTVLLALSPPEACYHLTVEQMAEPAVTVWIARDGDTVVGCGALKRHSETVGEVKRIFTRPAWQGQGIGRRILGGFRALPNGRGLKRSCSKPATSTRRLGRSTRRRVFPAAAPCSTTRIHRFPSFTKSSFSLRDPK